jgi:hypothetical protein
LESENGSLAKQPLKGGNKMMDFANANLALSYRTLLPENLIDDVVNWLVDFHTSAHMAFALPTTINECFNGRCLYFPERDPQ